MTNNFRGLNRRQWIALLGAAGASSAYGWQQRNDVPEHRRLSAGWPLAKLGAALQSRSAWRPYPQAGDRDAWTSLSPEIRAEAVERGERALAAGEWPSLRATQFLEYKREGNRSRYEASRNNRRNRLTSLVVAECVEGKGRFLDEIANGLWLTCEETWWGVPAHLNAQKRGPGLPDINEPVVDLFAAETGAQLAWIEHLLGPELAKVSPLVRERIGLEVERRILQPYEVREDWGWMGLKSKAAVNNWNPWINSNVLACALLLAPDPARRTALTGKVLRSLDRFLDGYHDDGGCDEGPGYWGRAGASLFDCLEVLDSATGGAVRFWDMPLVQEIGRYIYRVHIGGDWFVNFADASAKAGIAADLTCRYGERIGDEKMKSFGAWAAVEGRRRGGSSGLIHVDSLGRMLPALFHARELGRVTPRQPFVGEAWFPGIQVMTARLREGSIDGLYVAAQGGHNAESHNHNDVGNFVVFRNGEPLLIDVGVETYSAKTFSSRRYEIWTMQSGYHNCPTVNGVMQAPGRSYEARDVTYRKDDAGVELNLELAGAYPSEARLESWRRAIRLDRKSNEVIVRDTARRSGPGEVTLNLMTTSPANIERISIEGPAVERKVDEIAVEDSRLQSVWGKRLYRVRMIASNAPASASWTMRVKGA